MYKREIGKGGLFLMTSIRVREDIILYELGLGRSGITDDSDKKAYHAIIYDFGLPIGCARLIEDDEICKIERVMLTKSHRGKELYKDLIEGLKTKATELGYKNIEIEELKKELI